MAEFKYPVGTRVRVAWRPDEEALWFRVPFDEGVTGVLAIPQPHRVNSQNPNYVWVQLDPGQGTPTDRFSPGSWEEEGEFWRIESDGVVCPNRLDPACCACCGQVHELRGQRDRLTTALRDLTEYVTNEGEYCPYLAGAEALLKEIEQ